MIQRDTMTAAVVFVGGGPAGLSGALHLTRLIAAHNAAVAKGEKPGRPINEQTLGVDMVVAVIEKATNLGDRLVMMHRGQVIHDFRGAEKRRKKAEVSVQSEA